MIDPEGGVINCAHRGASGSAPENTMAAIEQAVELGADMVEIDVQPTVDGKLAVIHDATLARTTNGDGLVRMCTMAELKSFDAGSWYGHRWAGERIPELGEVLEHTRGRLRLNIELKEFHGDERALAELLRLLQDHDDIERCLVTSFDNELINDLKLRAEGLTVGYILGADEMPSWAFRARVELLSVKRTLVNAAFVEFSTAAAKTVHVWTVNDPAEMAHLIDLGVDGIITNHPELFPRTG